MFITLEGPDGCGKTVQTARLADFLKEAGYPVFQTREPGGTVIGDQVRSILFDLKNTGMTTRTEILLFQASRAQHVEEVIRPHLERGELVVCDRFTDSTLAYQGYGHQFDLEQLRWLVNFATGGLVPDMTILLDIDVEEGLRRRSKGGDWNRLDAYELAFHQRVREGYWQMARAEPERWAWVDAGRPVSEVQEEIRRVVLERLRIQET